MISNTNRAAVKQSRANMYDSEYDARSGSINSSYYDTTSNEEVVKTWNRKRRKLSEDDNSSQHSYNRTKKNIDAVMGSAWDEMKQVKLSREERKLQYYLDLFAKKEQEQIKKPRKQKTKPNTQTKNKKANKKKHPRQPEVEQDKCRDSECKIELVPNDEITFNCATNLFYNGGQFEYQEFKNDDNNSNDVKESNINQYREDSKAFIFDRRLSDTQHSIMTESTYSANLGLIEGFNWISLNLDEKWTNSQAIKNDFIQSILDYTKSMQYQMKEAKESKLGKFQVDTDDSMIRITDCSESTNSSRQRRNSVNTSPNEQNEINYISIYQNVRK